MEQTEKKILIPFMDYFFWIRGMTTKELCKTLPEIFVMPVWNGDKRDMIKAILALDAQKWMHLGEVGKFHKKALKPEYFLPMDKEGNVLEPPIKSEYGLAEPEFNTHKYPIECYGSDVKEYQEALSKVLFKGCYYEKIHKMDSIKAPNGKIISLKPQSKKEWEYETYQTIEDLTELDLELSDNAMTKP